MHVGIFPTLTLESIHNWEKDSMSTAAWLHGDQYWSHVGQKRIEPIVGYSVNEIRFLVFRIECGKATSSLARSRPTASYAIDVSSVDRVRFLAMIWTP